MRFAIVAGEPSGDLLGAGLMRALKSRDPDAVFLGVGGPLMQAAGLNSLVPFDRLAINGFRQPILRAPELLGIFRRVRAATLEFAPDVFIGVDFNVFNLLLERALKRHRVRTVHYVSPSVYAWRRGRLDRMRHSTDLMLTLFPFEAPLYHRRGIAAVFVGHPLADEIRVAGDRRAARACLGLDGAPLIALLPGSRMAEVALMGDLFLRAAAAFTALRPGARFVVACVDEKVQAAMRALLDASSIAARTSLVVGASRLVVAAADAALIKSGTGTLEAMLLERPMVVAYRLGRFTAMVVRRLLRTPHVALPNILAGRRVVPELLQEAATPEALAAELATVLSPAKEASMLIEFRAIAVQLRRGANAAAAEAVLAVARPPP